MMVSGREYDFARAEALVRGAVDRNAGTAYDAGTTSRLRSLRSPCDALAHIQSLALAAVRELPTASGGLRVCGNWPAFHPLIRLLRRLRSHPSWRVESRDEWETKANAVVAERGLLPWSFCDLVNELVAGIRHFLRWAELPTEAEPWQLTREPGVHQWMVIFCFLIAADEFGALDEGFARNEPLAETVHDDNEKPGTRQRDDTVAPPGRSS